MYHDGTDNFNDRSPRLSIEDPMQPMFESRAYWLRPTFLTVITVAVASWTGALATYPNLVPWYQSLAKPLFNPPNWVFAPVWIALYALMAFAASLIFRKPSRLPGRKTALVLFFTQLALNAAWSWMFFALHSPLAGMLNIIPQWLVVLATCDRFRRVDPMAGLCMLPLVVWVGFACVLNFEIWRLNG
jgi:translocator protein